MKPLILALLAALFAGTVVVGYLHHRGKAARTLDRWSRALDGDDSIGWQRHQSELARRLDRQ